MAASVSGAKNMYPAEALMVETVAEAAIFFTPETDAAISTGSRLNINLDAINKSHRIRAWKSRLLGSVYADLSAVLVLALKFDDPVDLGE